ncbi:hypothetical protein [Desulfocurvus sp.]|uniref:hypothetical protein n=1 Tax=Desulfocurvus sp. TaxID=2871698 RepID=UPI0025BBAA0B|nr:hypothetical protein [Desulfocurvus sp.]MCK9241177.1 hypothetical protein [Desulfocurvus sp.]
MAAPDPRASRPWWRRHGWKVAYFAAGILFIGLSRFFVPFWPRFIILSAWAVGMALIFIRQLEADK